MTDTPRPLSLTVADNLRAMVLRGEFAPGERMQEVALAGRMQVSRTPVREALRILAEDGLLVYSPNRGYAVKRFTREEILVAFRVRAATEGIGVRLLAERGADDRLLQKLDTLLAEGAALLAAGRLPGDDIAAWREASRRFHVALILATRSDLLVRIARDAQYIPVVNEGVFAWFTADDFRRQLMLQRMLVDAIRRRQPERAERLMHEYLLEAGELAGRHLPAD